MNLFKRPIRNLLHFFAKMENAAVKAAFFIVAPFRPQSGNKKLPESCQTDRQLAPGRDYSGFTSRFSGIGIWEIEIDSKALRWSPESFGLFGIKCPPKKIDLCLWWQKIHPEDRKSAENQIANAIKNLSSLKSEYRIILPDGKIRWIGALGNIFPGNNKNSSKMIGVFFDATENKTIQNDLRQTKQRYQNLFSMMTEGFSLNEIVRNSRGECIDYRIIDANTAFENYIGLKRDYFIGKLRNQILPPNPNSLEKYCHVVKTGQPVYFDNYSEPLGRYNRIYAYRPAAGQFAIIFSDITESKLAEKALRENEERSRQIADTMPNIVWIAEPDGKIELVNKRFRSYTGIDRFGDYVFDFLPLHVFDKTATKNAWHKAVQNKISYQIEHRVRRYDNSYRWHLSRGVPFRDAGGATVRWFGTATDIHEIKEAQKELQQADIEKNKFISMMSHELRNPLTPIVTGIELIRDYIKENDSDGAQLRQAIEEPARIIEEQANNMARLLNDLLDISRISRGKIDLKKTTVSVGRIMGLAAESVASLVNKQGHKLKISLPDPPTFIKADPVRLQQIIVNLLNNAIKYTPPGGNIWLKGFLDGNEAWITVRDSGIGLTAEAITGIFSSIQDPRGAAPFVSTHGEMGIGLKLTKDLVRMHNGIIQVKSPGPGEGCEFIVRFPALKNAETEKKDSTTADKKNFGLRAIVADDDKNTALLIGQALSSLGCEIAICHNGEETVAAAKKAFPDIVFTDIEMPGMNGYQVLRELRKIEFSCKKKIVIAAITGYGQKEDSAAALAQGFDLHMTKPVSIKTIREAIDRFSGQTPN